jgi:hypothetical protein
MANTLPRPAASWLAAPVKVAGFEVVTVLLELAVAEVVAVVARVVMTEVTGAAELPAGAVEGAGAAEVAGAGDEAGVAELEPPALSAAQAAWAFWRVAVDMW